MQKGALIGIILLLPTLGLAQDVSYSDISKALLNSETLRSPVYTKALYRDVRQGDTQAYNSEKERLKELKDKKIISTKSYNQQIGSLDKAYNYAYGKENVMQQGATISQNPVGSFYNEVMNDNQRLQLQLITNKALLKQMSSLPATDTTTAVVVPMTPITTTAPAPDGRRGLAPTSRLRAPEGSVAAEATNIPDKAKTPSASRKKALGEKSIPVNLSAFK